MLSRVAPLTVALLLAVSVRLVGQSPEISAEGPDIDRGLQRSGTLATNGGGLKYEKSHAIIVGINYSPSDAANPHPLGELRNAENDAKDLKDALVKLYGYQDKDIVLLTGAEATKNRIETAIGDLKEKVSPNESVLFFFAGHGLRIEDESSERGAILAHDSTLTMDGKPKTGHLRLHLDLLAAFKHVEAKHTLLILDACHSGEIFSLNIKPTSATDNRTSEALFAGRGSIQAIVSCRDRQKAADGPDDNSPFTKTLVRALQQFPTRTHSELSEADLLSEKARIPVTSLFRYMAPALENLPNNQSPDCRSLTGGDDGEFSFFPAANNDAIAEFRKFMVTTKEQYMLIATVPGEHGTWWFKEMPWFMPCLRQRILDELPLLRGSKAEQSRAIRKEQLRTLTESVRRKIRSEVQESQDKTSAAAKLQEMRLRHLERLLEVRRDITEAAKELDKDFLNHYRAFVPQTSDEPTFELEQAKAAEFKATDWHLWALIRSQSEALAGQPSASQLFENALKAFDKQESEPAMRAVCHADFGEYLFTVQKDFPRAEEQFRAASSAFGPEGSQYVPRPLGEATATQSHDSTSATTRSAGGSEGSVPQAFHIYVLCREADSWKARNRWGKADQLYLRAAKIAKDFNENHALAASVQHQTAWSFMEQWRISEAQEHFKSSNATLIRCLELSSEDNGAAPTAADEEKRFQQMILQDIDAAARYLHNEHGLAMVDRFEGSPENAAERYRTIIRLIAQSLERLKRDANLSSVTPDTEFKLVTRLINTQERLADCNLFGNPAERDLREALDDYRRALSSCTYLRDIDTRDSKRRSLLGRMAIVLSLPSDCQDLNLARAYLDEAQSLARQAGAKASGDAVTETIARISERIHCVYVAKHGAPAATGLSADDCDCANLHQALDSLSAEIIELREKHADLHRDQVEVLLVAGKVLVDEVPEVERFRLLTHSDMLHQLCDVILPRAVVVIADTGDNAQAADGSASDAEQAAKRAAEIKKNMDENRKAICFYLRPYFDTIINAKMRLGPKHAKELVQIQWEACNGVAYSKPAQATPVLAVYLMKDRCYLLYDSPRGVSKAFCLSGELYADAVLSASKGGRPPLPVPDELQAELLRIRYRLSAPAPANSGDSTGLKTSFNTAGGAEAALQLRWADPVHDIYDQATLTEAAKEALAGQTSTARPILPAKFPFALPAEILPPASIPSANQVEKSVAATAETIK